MTVPLINGAGAHLPGMETDELVAERLGFPVYMAGAPIPADVRYPCVVRQPDAGHLVLVTDPAQPPQPWSPSRAFDHSFGLLLELRGRGFRAGLEACPDRWVAYAARPGSRAHTGEHVAPEFALVLMFLKATGPLVTM